MNNLRTEALLVAVLPTKEIIGKNEKKFEVTKVRLIDNEGGDLYVSIFNNPDLVLEAQTLELYKKVDIKFTARTRNNFTNYTLDSIVQL